MVTKRESERERECESVSERNKRQTEENPHFVLFGKMSVKKAKDGERKISKQKSTVGLSLIFL